MKMMVKDLELLLLKIIDKLRQEGHHVIDLGDFDLYWNVSAPEWTDMSRTPELSVGSIRDDLESLKELSNPDHVTAYVDFDRLATVLHLISERLNPGKI